MAKILRIMKPSYVTGALCLLAITLTAYASSYTISFRLAGNHIVLQATVNGRTGYFILDTGVRDMVLNSVYFPGKTGAGDLQSVNGQTATGQGTHIQMHLTGGPSVRGYAAVIDLTSIETQKGFPVLGMVGMFVLQDYEIAIDYPAREITIYDLDRKGERQDLEPAPIPAEILAFRYKEHLPCFTAWIDGIELQLALDTGAGVNLLSTRLLGQLKGRLEAIGQKKLLGLGGQITTGPSGCLAGMQLGALILPPMETVFAPVGSLNQLTGPDLDGLLGHEFLRHYYTAINFRKKEIYLWDAEALRLGPLATGKN